MNNQLSDLPIFNAAGGVVLRNNNLLFIKKKMNWEFPKGKLGIFDTGTLIILTNEGVIISIELSPLIIISPAESAN